MGRREWVVVRVGINICFFNFEGILVNLHELTGKFNDVRGFGRSVL